MTVQIQYYDPEKDIAPRWESYQVPWDEQTSILDALGYIKDHLTVDFTFRWSCRIAICSVCGIMINDVPRLACKNLPVRFSERSVGAASAAKFPDRAQFVVDMSAFIEILLTINPGLSAITAHQNRAPTCKRPCKWRILSGYSTLCVHRAVIRLAQSVCFSFSWSVMLTTIPPLKRWYCFLQEMEKHVATYSGSTALEASTIILSLLPLARIILPLG
nr:2Fe-2S iron-sulfur cluster-binding protein [Sodalis-like endosymbiont of Proechinophthirus fluctus]